jgi:mRNA interferase RelE/StbE
MSWEIRYPASVERDVDRLPTHIRVRALRRVVDLAENPFPPGCRKLKGALNRYRLKITGDWRVVYSLFSESNLIKIEFVGHRKDACRWF